MGLIARMENKDDCDQREYPDPGVEVELGTRFIAKDAL